MPFCRNCASEVAEGDQFCKSCGAAAGLSVEIAHPGLLLEAGTGASVGGHVVTILGCVGLVLGPFLPWATAVIVSASGMQKTGNEALLVTLLGIAGIAVSVISLIQRRDMLRWVLFVVGGISLAFSLYYLIAIRYQLAELSDEILPVSLGVGIYVCIVASIVVIAGALGVALRRR
jgi:hypothetical protein